ncbi:hypothetical protein G5B46_13695 [Caulobacter sp. 602-2]|uniref:Uncharacterized protein n=1 Tax=Caulobacter sp. 602-2 TaxID=2710887 RepID=A0A6G4QYD9_9CAUL|nr:hypothetical protein [Caulobacter sp. 602-2]NGM50666.1 hypothetical protein [Caulobacter sp. 602-2]
MRAVFASVAGVLLLSFGSLCHAGAYSDGMSKCLVRSATADDKASLVVWMLVAISSHPAAKPYSQVTPKQRADAMVAAATVLDRLVLVACRREAVDVLRYEGPNALANSFELLGKIATQSLMVDPGVSRNLGLVGAYINSDGWSALGQEAGLPENGLSIR